MNWVQKKSLLAIKAISYQGSTCDSLDKLWDVLYQLYNSMVDCPINPKFLNKTPDCQTIDWPSFSKQELRDTAKKCLSLSTPGPDHISWNHIKSILIDEKCLTHLTNIANACIQLEY